MIKPDAYNHIGKILSAIEKDGFLIGNIKMTKMTLQDAQMFYAEHKGKPFYDELTNFISSDFIVGLELIATNCIKKWRDLIGPTKCQIARVEAPNSLRALYGTEGVRNACHGSDARIFIYLYSIVIQLDLHKGNWIFFSLKNQLLDQPQYLIIVLAV